MLLIHQHHMTKLVPFDDRVLVEALEEATTTASGIILPATQEKQQWKGKIVAVGPGKQLETGERLPLDLKIGEVIYFSKYAGEEFEADGKTYMSVSAGSIYAVER